MQKFLEKTKTWIKNNSGRLLLYAVILTGCFSIKYAAYGKYVDLLKDFTSVVASPFYFGSNYLGEIEEDRNYVIGTFNGSLYELDVEIRNNDNAYNYNKAGTDFYYYVTAELFEDENYTIPYTSDLYSTIIKYGKNNEYAGGMAKAVKDYQVIASPSAPGGKIYVRQKNIVIDSSTRTYNDEDEYKVLGRLDGLTGREPNDMADVKTEGKQTVRITIAWNGTIDKENIYLKVTAHTIPATSVNNSSSMTSVCKIDSAQLDMGSVLFPPGYKNAFTGTSAFPDIIDGYDKMQGIYATELIGKFNLCSDVGHKEKDVTKNISTNDSDYAVLFTFVSNANTKVKLYYDSSKLTPDSDLGAIYDGTYQKEGSSEFCDKYVIVNMFANGSKSCYFYRDTLHTVINKNDVMHEIVDNSAE